MGDVPSMLYPSFARRASATALVALCAAAAPAAAQQPAPGGVLTFSGLAAAVDEGAPGVLLTFGEVVSGSGNTRSFARFDAERGVLENVRVGQGLQPRPGFLRIGGYTFDLALVPSGGYGQDACYVAPEAGQRCSPLQTPGTDVSPFELVNVDMGDPAGPYSMAQFHLVGTVTGPSGGRRAAFHGVIFTYFPMPYQDALRALEDASADGGAGMAGLPYEAVFQVGPMTTAPEPSTVALAGAGFAVIAGVARARRRRNA